MHSHILLLLLTSKPILSPLVFCTPPPHTHTHNCVALISSPLLLSPFLILLLYLTIYFTLSPFLSHLSPLRWFVDSCGTEHKSILFITSHCTLHNPNRLFPLTQCKGTRTDTHTTTASVWH